MLSDGQVAIWWVRRDFRLADNPALRSAIDDGEAVLPLFVLDPVLLASAGLARRKWLMAAIYSLDHDLRDAGGPGLSVLSGKPYWRSAPDVGPSASSSDSHTACSRRSFGSWA